jgi:hemolysin activation/secretion protein
MGRIGSSQPEGLLVSDDRAGRGVRRGAKTRITLGAVLLFADVLAAGAAAAQMPSVAQLPGGALPGAIEPGRDRPIPAPAQQPQFEFEIPSPRRGPVPRAVDEITFDVSAINVVGSTVFPAEAFKPITDPLIGKSVRLSDVLDAADKIEALYRSAGYVLTRAFVPPQTVGNGVFQITVVEGYVKGTSVSGGDDSTRERVETYIAPVTETKPARLDTLERALLLANQLPGTSASGLLRPSPTESGASDLVVNVAQEPWVASIYTDNRGASATGVWTLGGQFAVNSLFGEGGQFVFDASGTPDFSERNLFQARYTLPVGNDGLQLSLSGVLSHGQPGGLGGAVVSDSNAIGTRASYPILTSRPLSLSVEGGLTSQSADVNTVGVPFTSERWRVLDVAATVRQRGFLDSMSAATLGIAQGLPGLGATAFTPTMSNMGSPGFTKMTAVLTHDQPVFQSTFGPLSYSLRAIAQYAFERLVIGEQISFGGATIGRGYDPATLAGDIGFGGAQELRYDLRFPQYYIDQAQLYAFVDAARIWTREGEFVPVQSLASIGFGVRVSLLERLTSGIEFAHTLKGVPTNDNGNTGSRILFNAAVRF